MVSAAWSDERPTSLLVVEPGQGQPLVGAAPVTIAARSAWTDGGFCVFDQIVPPRSMTAAHRHAKETQGAYIIEGTIGFWVDGEAAIGKAGSYVLRPVGSLHALWNPTDEPAHMLEITSPATDYQTFILELDELVRSGGGREQIRSLAGRWGTVFDQDVTDELCSRYGVGTEGGGYGE